MKITDQELSELIERQLVIDKLETDLGLARVAMAQTIAPKRLAAEIDNRLKYWGYRYVHEDKREILRDTGIVPPLGRLFRNKNGYDRGLVFDVDSSTFEQVNGAVNRMPVFYRVFIGRHYIVDNSRSENRNGKPVKAYAERMDIPRRTYYNHLDEAKELLKVLGVV